MHRAEPRNVRKELVASHALLAEEIVAHPDLPPSGVTTQRQLAITYAGAFGFEVGRSFSWVDPSRLLFVEAGQDFVDHHVVPNEGHRTVILTPAEATIEEAAGRDRTAFDDRLRSCSLSLQMLVQKLRRAAQPLEAEELALEILLRSFEASRAPAYDPACVRKAKAVLHESEEPRLLLADIAAKVGVSVIHLTQSFKRSQGMPLYRYQTQLRLSRALAVLPEREDITDLALELGFSSHSHFTAAFRSALGVTPSDYRRSAQS